MKGYTLKEKNLLPIGEPYFLLEQLPFQTRGKYFKQSCLPLKVSVPFNMCHSKQEGPKLFAYIMYEIKTCPMQLTKVMIKLCQCADFAITSVLLILLAW